MEITKVVSGQRSVPGLYGQSVSGLWSVYTIVARVSGLMSEKLTVQPRTALSIVERRSAPTTFLYLTRGVARSRIWIRGADAITECSLNALNLVAC